MHVVNDEKISALGRYFRFVAQARVRHLAGEDVADKLSKCVNESCDEKPEIVRLLDSTKDCLLGWEVAHRSDNRRKVRKLIQLAVDLVTFVASGCVCLVAYFWMSSAIDCLTVALMIAECTMLLVLGWQIISYCDWGTGK
jgi:hypothetical protein